MGFRCEGLDCVKPRVPAGVKPIMVVVATRSTSYNTRKMDEEDKMYPCIVLGEEIAREAKLCPACAGLKEATLRPPTEEMLFTMMKVKGPVPGTKAKDHRKGCKDSLAECEMCQKYMEAGRVLPLHILSTTLEQPLHPQLRVSLLKTVLAGVDRRYNHQSKRAAADLQAAYTILAPYDRRLREVK